MTSNVDSTDGLEITSRPLGDAFPHVAAIAMNSAVGISICIVGKISPHNSTRFETRSIPVLPDVPFETFHNLVANGRRRRVAEDAY